jgi:hypothetical protein
MASKHTGYFVFEMAVRDRAKPIRQVSKKSLELEPAKQLARIGATEGKHDRAVTTNPRSRSFQIVAQYERGTGQNVTQQLYGRGGGMRDNRHVSAPAPMSRHEPEIAYAEPAFPVAGPEPARVPLWRFDPITGEPIPTIDEP